jgi:hypothetical protein
MSRFDPGLSYYYAEKWQESRGLFVDLLLDTSLSLELLRDYGPFKELIKPKG